MLPLAVSGQSVVAVVIAGALLLLVRLLRADAREHPEEREEADQRTVTSQRSE
jgi:hypothetical protein